MKRPDLEMEVRADGAILLRSRHAPVSEPRSIPHLLADRAERHPDHPFILQREAHGWCGLTYGSANAAADAVGAWLLDRGFGAEDAVLILSGNSVDHAALMLGGYASGVPIVPLSAGFSLLSDDFGKLRHCQRLLSPKIAFAQSSRGYARAIQALRDENPDIVMITGDGGDGTIPFAELLGHRAGRAVAETRAGVGPATIAKYLFTSGSTGLPKAVPQTQAMLTSAIAAEIGLFDGRPAEPPVTLEWMPWSHVSAGNVSMNRAIWHGGTIHIDEGKPTPTGFAATIRNIPEVSPTMFASTPIAFAMLADAMERDRELRRAFFARMRYLSYGGAALVADVFDRIQALAAAETGRRIPFTTMYGATETQVITSVHWLTERPGLLGLPLPGVSLKLAPIGEKLEVRVKGPSVASGYIGDPEKTAAAFDEEGYYKLGDACRFLDGEEPLKGLVFDGRVTEDFKLTTGTWVSVGTLRVDVVAACAPYVSDLLVAGHDRDQVGALVWVSENGRLLMRDRGLAALHEALAERLRLFNASVGGGSRRVSRFLVLDRPPSMDDGEISDKGYVNQREALARRKDLVDRLYADPAPGDVVSLT